MRSIVEAAMLGFTHFHLQHVTDDFPQIFREGTRDTRCFASANFHGESNLVGCIERRAVDREMVSGQRECSHHKMMPPAQPACKYLTSRRTFHTEGSQETIHPTFRYTLSHPPALGSCRKASRHLCVRTESPLAIREQGRSRLTITSHITTTTQHNR